MSVGACGEFVKSQITENFYNQHKKTSAFIYVICNRTETVALEYIQRAFNTTLNAFNQRKDLRFTRYKFTALMASAWMKTDKITKYLLKAGADPMIKDAGGNTFHHYLAMAPTPEALKILDEHGEKSTPNKVGDTWKDILETRQLPDPSKQFFYYRPSPEEEIKKGNGHKFIELTNSSGAESFLDKARYFTEKSILEVWKKSMQKPSSKDKQPFEAEYQKAYNEFEKASSSPLFMERHPKVEWNIRARREIKKGEVIAEFFGEQFSDREKQDLASIREKLQKNILIRSSSTLKQEAQMKILMKYPGFPSPSEAIDKHLQSEFNSLVAKEYEFTEYLLETGDIETTMRKKRDMASEINDGFPNVVRWTLSPTNAMPCKEILIANVDIQFNDIVTYGYGLENGIKKHRVHHELRLEAAIQFIKDCRREFSQSEQPLFETYERYRKRYLDVRCSFDVALQRESVLSDIFYLLHTPTTILRLFKEGVIRGDEFVPIYEQHLLKHASKGLTNRQVKRYKDFQNFSKLLAQVEKRGKDEFFKVHAEEFDENLSFDQIASNLRSILKKN